MTVKAVATFVTFVTAVYGAERCQRREYLNSTNGDITEPLYPNGTAFGLRSCWYLSEPKSGDYIAAVYMKEIVLNENSAIHFSDSILLYRERKNPYCLLFLRANNICSRAKSVAALHKFFPECRSSYRNITVKTIPTHIVLDSNEIKRWKDRSLRFHIQYRFLSCDKDAPEPAPTLDPCGRLPTHEKQEQRGGAGFDMLPIVIALACLLALALLALLVVGTRLRRMRSYVVQQNIQRRIVVGTDKDFVPLRAGDVDQRYSQSREIIKESK